MLEDTGNKQAVRILLECILVFNENSITSVIAVLTLTLGVNEPLNRPLVHHYYHRCLQLLNSVDFLQVRDYRFTK